MDKHSDVAILTLISNAKGFGPGHSAIVVHGTVYTFEEIGLGDSWLVMPVKDYLAKNTHRPLIVQELVEQVNANKVLEYVRASIQDDDDYVESGVCSSQVASAVQHGWGRSFDPKGPDTPESVFELARKKSIVRRTYYYWPGKDGLGETVRKRLEQRLQTEHPELPLAPADGIRDRAAHRPPVAPAPVAPPASEVTVPVIQKQTTLSGVALAQYGSYELWPLIWDANRAISNPNRLDQVRELKVRPLSSYSAAQVADAKARAPSWKKYPA